MDELLDRLPEPLRRQLGPLPVWAWIAALAGGALVAARLRSGAPADDTEQLTDPTGAPSSAHSTGGVLGGAGTGSVQLRSGTIYAPSPVTDAAPTGPANNNEWRRAAAAYLIGRNRDALAVDRALARYLAGEQLDAAAEALVNEALAAIGPTPDPVLPPLPPAPELPTPADPPPPVIAPVEPPPVAPMVPDAGIFTAPNGERATLARAGETWEALAARVGMPGRGEQFRTLNVFLASLANPPQAGVDANGNPPNGSAVYLPR